MTGFPGDVRDDPQGAAGERPERRPKDLHGLHPDGDAGVRRSANEKGHVRTGRGEERGGAYSIVASLTLVI